MEFEEHVVIVTGAARGVGKETAIRFSENGADVVLLDILEKEVKEVQKAIQDMGNKVLSIKMDVSDEKQVFDAVKKTVDRFGKIDVLVNNAAVAGPIAPIIELTEDDWDKTFGINLKSAFFFCKSVVPVMLNKKRGNIVNVGSIAGKEGNENLAAYSASKAGVHCFSRVLANELAGSGIRVNCIAPALINTDMVKKVKENAPPGLFEKLLEKIPIGRMGEPEEVAEVILFLASDRSSFIDGQCINVTGGRGHY